MNDSRRQKGPETGPVPPGPAPESPHEAAAIAWELYRVALAAGDFNVALRALRTVMDCRGWTGEANRRRTKPETAAGLQARLLALGRALKVEGAE